MGYKQIRFHVEPIFEHMPEEFFKKHERAIKAWLKNGITVFEVDRICTKYGIHPFAVYGTYWYSDMWREIDEPV